MFSHSKVVLVHQTSKRKRVIAEPEGAPAKSLKNVVVPEKSDSTPLILAIQPVKQNVDRLQQTVLIVHWPHH